MGLLARNVVHHHSSAYIRALPPRHETSNRLLIRMTKLSVWAGPQHRLSYVVARTLMDDVW